MNELLEGFLKAVKDDKQGLSVAELMTEDELLQWEILVKAMDSIDIMKIGVDLEKISKTYQLEKWQEMAIIAYVKVLEIMVKSAKENVPEAFSPRAPSPPQHDSYTGSMFG